MVSRLIRPLHLCGTFPCLVIGLGIPFAVVPTTFGNSLAGSSQHQIDILSDPQPSSSPRIDLGRRFGEIPCPSRESRKTMGEALRSDAKRILIHQFDERTWGDLETVRGYLGRLLNAEPEGGMLSPAVYWAEARPAEIFASVAPFARRSASSSSEAPPR